MAEKRARRNYSEEFKNQMVQLYNAGEPRAEIIREYDLTSTAFDRWVKRINSTGSSKECDYRNRLKSLNIRQSMSRKGDPYDNAVAENFFSCLNCELVHLRHFFTRREAQNAVFAYIEAFYNTIRPHSALGRLSPGAFEVAFRTSLAA